MVSRRDVLKAVNEWYSLSETKFRQCLYAILEAMSNEELLWLMINADDLGVRMKAWRILEERAKKIVNNSLEHHDGIDAKDYEPGLSRTDHYDVVDNETSEKLGDSKPGSKMVERV
ncbi:MAG: hypothetical protein QXQ31_05720 [Zestosphaera sp.]